MHASLLAAYPSSGRENLFHLLGNAGTSREGRESGYDEMIHSLLHSDVSAGGRSSAVLNFENLEDDDKTRIDTIVQETVPNSVLDEGGTIHMYLSSPSASALGNHTDTTDIFVLHLHGVKEWTFCAPKAKDHSFHPKLDLCSRYNADEMAELYCEKAKLYPGDGLFLPRRIVHSAKAVIGSTSHLTFGFDGEQICPRDVFELDVFSSSSGNRVLSHVNPAIYDAATNTFSCYQNIASDSCIKSDCDSGCDTCCGNKFICLPPYNCGCDTSCTYTSVCNGASGDSFPSVTCKQFVYNLSSNAALFAIAYAESVYDSCCGKSIDDNPGCMSLSIDRNPPLPYSCNEVGSKSITVTLTDHKGNTDTCISTVNVVDDVLPNAYCRSVSKTLGATGSATVTVPEINNGSSDNCGLKPLKLDQTTFDCSNIGSNTVELTVEDVNDNTAACTATVTVEDATAPTATCKSVSKSLDAKGTATITASDVNNGSSDNCGLKPLKLDQTTFDCSNIGSNQVILTVEDVNDNTAACTAQVSIVDNEQPKAMCQNAIINLDAKGGAMVDSAVIASASTDNCPSLLTYEATKSTFGCSDLGTNDIAVTVTDGGNNADACSAQILVKDTIAPSVVCRSLTVDLDENGFADLVSSAISDSTDNCPTTSSVSPSSFSCANVGPNTASVTVTDGSGNIGTCEALVQVEENINPDARCKDVTITLDTFGRAVVEVKWVRISTYGENIFL